MIEIDDEPVDYVRAVGPHQGVLVLVNEAGADLTFSTLKYRGEVLVDEPTPESLRPDLNPTYHVLRKDEAMFFFTDTPGVNLDPDDLALVQQFLRSFYDLEVPHLKEILKVFGDSEGAIQDSAWLMVRDGDPYRTEPVDREGWHEPNVTIDGDGHANNRYNHALHAIAAASLDTTQANVEHALRVGWGAMCFGIYGDGPNKGRQRPEKGKGAYGWFPWDHTGKPLWSKTHVETLIVMLELTDHPYLWELATAARDSFVGVGEKWWDGKWGARGPSRWLDGLIALEHSGWDLDEINPQEVVDHLMSRFDYDQGLWVNNGDLTITSPWMNLQLVRSLHRYCKMHDLRIPAEVFQCYETILSEYTDGTGGVFYRCAGPTAEVRYGTSSAWLASCAAELEDCRTMAQAELRQDWRHGIEISGSYGSNVIKDFAIWAINGARNYDAFKVFDYPA